MEPSGQRHWRYDEATKELILFEHHTSFKNRKTNFLPEFWKQRPETESKTADLVKETAAIATETARIGTETENGQQIVGGACENSPPGVETEVVSRRETKGGSLEPKGGFVEPEGGVVETEEGFSATKGERRGKYGDERDVCHYKNVEDRGDFWDRLTGNIFYCEFFIVWVTSFFTVPLYLYVILRLAHDLLVRRDGMETETASMKPETARWMTWFFWIYTAVIIFTYSDCPKHWQRFRQSFFLNIFKYYDHSSFRYNNVALCVGIPT